MLMKPTPLNWQDMNYWNSGEWQVIQDRLDERDQKKIRYNPSRINMFNALDAVASKDVKVAIFGQDPYPDPKFATGFAFSIPKVHKEIPPTLKNIFQEYCTDLQLPAPSNGCLEAWVNQGVLLWNVIPTCDSWVSMSHDWDEYSYLTKDILSMLSSISCVLVYLGSVSRRYSNYLDISKNNIRIIETSHPSPRGSLNSKTPFIGSRLFSTINSKLEELEVEPIQWRL